MSYLSSALEDYLSSNSITQSQLSDVAGIARPQLNRTCKGQPMRASTLLTLIKAIPEMHQAPILVGWLKDQVKPHLYQLVIQPNLRPIQENGVDAQLPAELDGETRSLIVWLARQSIVHDSVKQMLRSLKRVATAGIAERH